MGEKRDIQRIMEREIRKGSCPLRFERMEFQKDAYRPVLSEQDLEEAFDYLLRLGKFRWYEEKTVINNIYMNYDVIRGNITMKRAKSYLLSFMQIGRRQSARCGSIGCRFTPLKRNRTQKKKLLLPFGQDNPLVYSSFLIL